MKKGKNGVYLKVRKLGKHKKTRNHHHLIPTSRGGNDIASNLLLLWNDKHEMFHKIFGNLTLTEIINLLIEVRRRKGFGSQP